MTLNSKNYRALKPSTYSLWELLSILSAYLLTTYTYKRMRLLTRVYGILHIHECSLYWYQYNINTLNLQPLHHLSTDQEVPVLIGWYTMLYLVRAFNPPTQCSTTNLEFQDFRILVNEPAYPASLDGTPCCTHFERCN